MARRAAAPRPAFPLEERLERALHSLEAISPSRPSIAQIEDHLALFTRWCFRPVAKRTGEAVFADPSGAIPHKTLVRAISRVARGATVSIPAATT